MLLKDMETAANKMMQGKTVASCEVYDGFCKIIFEDTSFVTFWVKTFQRDNTSILAMNWGSNADSSSN